jgi:hypothetical protein
MAREEIAEFDGIPWEVYHALSPLIQTDENGQGINSSEVITEFLAAWQKAPHSFFTVEAGDLDRAEAEERLIQFARVYTVVKTGALIDGESQHG